MNLALSGRLFRFLVVGVSNTGLSALIFTLVFRNLEGVSGRAAIAQTTAYLIAMAWSFYWNKKWTFRSKGPARNEGVGFISVQLLLLVMTSGALGVLVDVMGLSALYMWILVMAVATVLNFLLLHTLVFKQDARGNISFKTAKNFLTTAPGRYELAGASVVIFFVSFFFIEAHLYNFWLHLDDGFYAEAARRMLAGEIPHRDFHDFHPGLIQFTHLAAFKFFGVSFGALRLPLLAIGAVLPLLCFWSVRKQGRMIAWLSALTGLAFGVVVNINPSANWYALFLALLTTILLVRGNVRQSGRVLFAVGVLVGLTFLYRSLNGVFLGFGVMIYLLGAPGGAASGQQTWLVKAVSALILTILVIYLAGKEVSLSLFIFGSAPILLTAFLFFRGSISDRESLYILKWTIAGGLAALLPLISYHLWHGSLDAWFYDVFELPFTLIGLEYVTEKRYQWYLSAAFESLSEIRNLLELFSILGWVFLIFSPVIVGGVVFYRRLSRNVVNAEYWHPVTVIAIFYAVAALHYEVTMYLIWIIIPVLMAFLVLSGSMQWWLRLSSAATIMTVSIVSLLTNVDNPFLWRDYQIVTLGRIADQAVMPLAGSPEIMTGRRDGEKYQAIVNKVLELTPEQGTLFVMPANPDIIFLTQRKDPTRHPIPGVSINNQERLNAVTDQFDRAPPDLILISVAIDYKTAEMKALEIYTEERFTFVGEIGGFRFFIPHQNRK